MKVHDIMTRGCECIAPENTLEEAARRMRALDVGPLPVCENGRLAGMITDRDIVVRAVAEGYDPKMVQVRDVMTPHIMYCFEEQDVEDAARLMRRYQIRRLAVLDRKRKLAGILSLGDIAVNVGNSQITGQALERISEPATVGEAFPW